MNTLYEKKSKPSQVEHNIKNVGLSRPSGIKEAQRPFFCLACSLSFLYFVLTTEYSMRRKVRQIFIMFMLLFCSFFCIDFSNFWKPWIECLTHICIYFWVTETLIIKKTVLLVYDIKSLHWIIGPVLYFCLGLSLFVSPSLFSFPWLSSNNFPKDFSGSQPASAVPITSIPSLSVSTAPYIYLIHWKTSLCMSFFRLVVLGLLSGHTPACLEEHLAFNRYSLNGYWADVSSLIISVMSTLNTCVINVMEIETDKRSLWIFFL